MIGCTLSPSSIVVNTYNHHHRRRPLLDEVIVDDALLLVFVEAASEGGERLTEVVVRAPDDLVHGNIRLQRLHRRRQFRPLLDERH